MITLKLQGRFGNQMFQYAFARGLQERFYKDDSLMINIEGILKHNNSQEGWTDSLKYFNVKKYTYSKKLNINIFQRIVLFSFLVIRKIARMFFVADTTNFEIKVSPFLNWWGLYCINTGYFECISSRFKNKLIVGCFECDKYFENVKEQLLIEFEPKQEIIKSNLKMYKAIEENQSICVTIRRGDFLSDAFKKDHYVCTEKYFEKGIKEIFRLVENPKFFVFSDDVQWVKDNMDFPADTMYETGADPIWEKLRMMYNCKHFIISNSTFSWWAQYLGRYDDKVVIAPSKWNNRVSANDIYQEGWIRIDV